MVRSPAAAIRVTPLLHRTAFEHHAEPHAPRPELARVLRSYSSRSALTERRSLPSAWSIVCRTVQPPSGGGVSSCSSVNPNSELISSPRDRHHSTTTTHILPFP